MAHSAYVRHMVTWPFLFQVSNRQVLLLRDAAPFNRLSAIECDSDPLVEKKPGSTGKPGFLILWSQRQESNPQPTDYKSVALPLRHAGKPSANYAIS